MQFILSLSPLPYFLLLQAKIVRFLAMQFILSLSPLPYFLLQMAHKLPSTFHLPSGPSPLTYFPSHFRFSLLRQMFPLEIDHKECNCQPISPSCLPSPRRTRRCPARPSRPQQASLASR